MKPCVFIFGAFDVLFFRSFFRQFVVLVIKQTECIFVQIQFHQTALVIDGHGCTVFNSLGHVIDVDVVAENLPRVVVVLFDRRTCKTDERRIGQKFTHDSRKAEF